MMQAKSGDIYCVYNFYLKKYTACQVTKLENKDERQTAVLLSLDWSGDQPLKETELSALRPLYQDFMYWPRELHLVNVEPEVPANYILAGNISPLTRESTNFYSSWDEGYRVYRQLKWQEIPQEQRNAFKKAVASQEKVLFAGQETAVSLRRLQDDWVPFENALELKAFPCLSYLACKKWHAGLYEYLRGNPFLTELVLENHRQKRLDFAGAHIHDLSIDMNGVEELYLNDDLEQLTFLGEIAANCQIHAAENGAKLLLNASATVPSGRGLESLGKLRCMEIAELDLAEVLKAYPMLRQLRLWGKPGMLSNFALLSRFTKLEGFTTVDLFGFSAADIPAPESMPSLNWFWMSSLPEDAAKRAKQLYKKRKEQGLDLWIQKARKLEWLAKNLDNPFRAWDGQENISAANAKKAADLYRRTRAGILKLTGSSPGEAAPSAEALVRAYTEGFNKMDKRKYFIETVEREDIYSALVEILDLLPAELAIDKEGLLRIFDEMRDF